MSNLHTPLLILLCAEPPQTSDCIILLSHSSASCGRLVLGFSVCWLCAAAYIALGTRGMCAQNEDNAPTVTHLGALQMSDSGRECWFWVCLPQDQGLRLEHHVNKEKGTQMQVQAEWRCANANADVSGNEIVFFPSSIVADADVG